MSRPRIGRPPIPGGACRTTFNLREPDLKVARKIARAAGRPYGEVLRDWLTEGATSATPFGFRKFRVCWTGPRGAEKCREVVARDREQALDRLGVSGEAGLTITEEK